MAKDKHVTIIENLQNKLAAANHQLRMQKHAVEKYLDAAGHDLCHDLRAELAQAFNLTSAAPKLVDSCEFAAECLVYQQSLFGDSQLKNLLTTLSDSAKRMGDKYVVALTYSDIALIHKLLRTEPPKSVQASHPGLYLREELAERALSVDDFARTAGIPLETLQDILAEKRPVTLDIASALACALGQSAETWMRLQQQYDQHSY